MKNVPSFTFLAALSLFVSSAAFAGDAVTLTWKKGASEADNARTATLTLAAGVSAKAKWGGRSADGTTYLRFDGVSLNLNIFCRNSCSFF